MSAVPVPAGGALLDDLAGRRVLVTGAGSGIGLAIARRFAEHGALVGATVLPGDDAGAAALAAVVPAGGGRVIALDADVTDAAQVEAAVARFAAEAGGAVEVLVSNAGIGQSAPFLELTNDDWERMLKVHVGGAVNTTRAVLPGMLEAGWGRVLYTASELVTIGFANLTHYCAAKGALASMARALAREVGPAGITVNCVAPGPTMTPMFVKSEAENNDAYRETIPLRQFGEPDNVAWTWLFLASDAGRWYTGQMVAPNGGVAM